MVSCASGTQTRRSKPSGAGKEPPKCQHVRTFGRGTGSEQGRPCGLYRLFSRPCRIDRGGAGRRSDGDPGINLGQVETERALGPGTDEADRPQLRFAELALDLGLRLMTRRAFMNRGTRRLLGVPHEAHAITVSSGRLRCSAHPVRSRGLLRPLRAKPAGIPRGMTVLTWGGLKTLSGSRSSTSDHTRGSARS
jgi:hypothetical protein